AGVVGVHAALQLLDRGLSIAIIDPHSPGGRQAASYGNAAWLGSHSVVPQALPGVWRKVPTWLRDPLGPLALRPGYLPRALPWLWRYLQSGSSRDKVEATARVMRTLLVDTPALHAEAAARADIAHTIDAHSGLLHVYRDRASLEDAALAWQLRRQAGLQWEMIEGDALAARLPGLAPQYRCGVFVAEAGHCRNPGGYVAGLAAYAERRGALRVRAPATGFRRHGEHVAAVVTPVGEIACDAAVIAAGIHSRPLARAAGDRGPLHSERGYHVQIDDAAAEVAPGPDTPVMVGERKVGIVQLEQGLRCAGQVEIGGLAAGPDWRRADILYQHLRAVLPAVPADLSPARL